MSEDTFNAYVEAVRQACLDAVRGGPSARLTPKSDLTIYYVKRTGTIVVASSAELCPGLMAACRSFAEAGQVRPYVAMMNGQAFTFQPKIL